MGAIFAPTRFSLVRISIRDLVADGKSLVRKSGVGGGGDNRILSRCTEKNARKCGTFVDACDESTQDPGVPKNKPKATLAQTKSFDFRTGLVQRHSITAKQFP